jgi:hypothetical protein
VRQHRPDQPGLLGRGDCEAVRRAERGHLAVEGKVAVVRHKLGSYHVAFEVSEGGLHLNPNVSWLVFSQLGAGHEWVDRWRMRAYGLGRRGQSPLPRIPWQRRGGTFGCPPNGPARSSSTTAPTA